MTVRAALLLAALFAAALPLYLARNTTNPPGYFFDEASISYEAMTIEQRGVDEWGNSMPLFFKSGGDYKSSPYIYLLAAVYHFTGPGRTAARDFSGVLGDLTAAALGWLAWMLSRQLWVAAATFISVVFTPSMFEMSHVVFEVALYPLVFTLFLMALLHASRRERWTAWDVIFLAITLSLCTYAYAIGRMYGPMLVAEVCIFFYTRRRRNALTAIVLLYIATTVVPMTVYQIRLHGALTERFLQLSYLDEPVPMIAHDFVSHYLEDFDPVQQALTGDPNPRHHVKGSGGNILIATLVLAFTAIAGAGRDASRWRVFLIFALVLGTVPAALTSDRMHNLRMVPYATLMIVLSAMALTTVPRRMLAALTALALLQSAWFFVHFYRDGTATVRQRAFQSACEPVTLAALSRQSRPIYLIGHVFAMDSIWYAWPHGWEMKDFVIRDPAGAAPAGAVVISNAVPPGGAREIYGQGGFWTYLAPSLAIAPPARARRPL